MGTQHLFDAFLDAKKQSESELKEIDHHNIVLQNLQYEKDYFVKEIHFCKELKTPNLQLALKADVYDKFKNLPTDQSDELHRRNLEYLQNELHQRKILNERYNIALQEREKAASEFERKQKLIAEFPMLLRNLEEVVAPLAQEYLDYKFQAAQDENLPNGQEDQEMAEEDGQILGQ